MPLFGSKHKNNTDNAALETTGGGRHHNMATGAGTGDHAGTGTGTVFGTGGMGTGTGMGTHMTGNNMDYPTEGRHGQGMTGHQGIAGSNNMGQGQYGAGGYDNTHNNPLSHGQGGMGNMGGGLGHSSAAGAGTGAAIPPAGMANNSGNTSGGTGQRLAGKTEQAIGTLVGSSALKAKGLQKEQEANAIKLQGTELAEAERLEREAMMRRERAVGHGAHPANSRLGAGHVGGTGVNPGGY